MKLDKETLYKNRFWVSLGVIAFLVLIAVTWLTTDVSAALDEERATIEKRKAELGAKANAGAPLAGEEEKKVLEEKREGLNKRRGTLWEEAWEAQNKGDNPLMVWPAVIQKKKDLTELNFGETDTTKFDPALAQDYVTKAAYFDQYDDGKLGGIVNIFKVQVPGAKAPLEPVKFKDDNWKKVLRRYIPKWENNATIEEVWLAQEDFWVYREVLRALKGANDTVARFAAVDGAGKLAAGEIARQRFINRTWQIDLHMALQQGKPVVSGTIKNVSEHKQNGGRFYLAVRLYRDETAPKNLIEVQTDPLGVEQEWILQPRPLLGEVGGRPEGLFDLETVWDEQTSPVRRIDQVALFAHGHRTYEPTLMKLPRAGTDAAEAPTGDDAKEDAGLERTKDNKLVRARYYDVTPQVRRLPLGLVVIVDQAHVPEVLTALANCKLRFQTTQANVQHFSGSLVARKDGEPGSAGAEGAGDLVELSVYGIASLYDRPAKDGGEKKDDKDKERPKKVKDKGKDKEKAKE